MTRNRLCSDELVDQLRQFSNRFGVCMIANWPQSYLLLTFNALSYLQGKKRDAYARYLDAFFISGESCCFLRDIPRGFVYSRHLQLDKLLNGPIALTVRTFYMEKFLQAISPNKPGTRSDTFCQNALSRSERQLLLKYCGLVFSAHIVSR